MKQSFLSNMHNFLGSLFYLAFEALRQIPTIQSSIKINIYGDALFNLQTAGSEFSYQETAEIREAHLTPYGKYYGYIFDDFSDTYGRSTACMSTTGDSCTHVNPTAEQSRLNPADQNSHLLRVTKSPNEKDNCVGLLYNLIRMFYATTMKHIEYDPDERFYQGNHVFVTNRQFFGEELPLEYKWIPTANVLHTRKDVFYEDCDEVWLHWTGYLGLEDANILSAAVSCWNGTSSLGVLHSSPTLTYKPIRIVSDYGREHFKNSPLFLRRLTSIEVKRVIGNLVRSNKLERAFLFALAMVAQVYVNYKPSTTDGLIWCCTTKLVNIPVLRSHRGWCKLAVTGYAYEADTCQAYAFQLWMDRPQNLLWLAADLCEVVHHQMREVAAYHKNHPHLNDFFDSAKSAGLSKGLALDLMLAAQYQRARIVEPLPTIAGVQRFCRQQFTDAKHLVRVTLESVQGFFNYPNIDGYTKDAENAQYPLNATMVLTQHVPFLFSSIEPLSHQRPDAIVPLTITATLAVDAGGRISTNSNDEFINFMRITRMMRLTVSGTQFYPWRFLSNRNANDMGCFTYHPTPQSPHTHYSICLWSLVKDGGPFIDLLPLKTFVKISVTIRDRHFII